MPQLLGIPEGISTAGDRVSVTEEETVIGIRLNQAQATFFASMIRAVLYLGGRGTGKTHVGVRTAYRFCKEYPRAIGLITANTYRQLNEVTLKALFLFLHAIGEEYVYNKAPTWYRSPFKDHKGILSLRCGAQVVCRSLDNYDDIRGGEFGWWYADEVRDTKKEAFDVVLACMRDRNMPMVGPNEYWRPIRCTTTPDGYDWTYEYWDEALAIDTALAGDRQIITSSTYDNYANLGADFVRMLEDSYDEDVAQQELWAQRVAIGIGIVYAAFNREVHRDSDIIWDKSRELFLSCDFNVTPIAFLIAQEDDDGVLNVIDEVVRKYPRAGMCATESASLDFIDRYGSHGQHVTIYGDPAGTQRQSQTTQTDYSQVARILRTKFAGRMKLSIPTDHPPVIDSVNLVNALLRNSRKQVRLRVHPRCKHLCRDLEQVRWKESAKVREIDKTKDKSLTHPSDALRYLCWGRKRLGTVVTGGSGHGMTERPSLEGIE